MEGKIFGVGLNKTGITTLVRALEILGFRTFHHESAFYPARRVEVLSSRAIAEGQDPLAYLPGHLGRPVHAVPFPRLNVEGSGGRPAGQQSRRDRLVRGLARRLRRAVWSVRVPRSS
ncbi:hypothetical protein L1785_14740 [Antribacter sp. KLBMP9083]|uniref:Sulfotransferase family protein n=1 Tax=Antribacter soli TaxID=2910976 RepID=A0AA41U8B2_9MICO|nr:hypothetical protein [Antribacter soli]MCF4122235.1 hypothetical protein [Antribacter soli]